MKKSNRKILFGIGIIIGIFIIAYLGFNKPLAIGDVDTSGCGILQSGSIQSTFPCNGVSCDVNGKATCETINSGNKVVSFRTNIDSSSGSAGLKYKWIALDTDKNGIMESYVSEGAVSSTVPSGSQFTRLMTFRGYDIYKKLSSSELYATGGFTGSVKFLSTTGAEVSSQEKEPYKSNGQELYSGTSNSYSCSKQWKITRASGSVETGTVAYNSENKGEYATGVKTLYKGDKFDWGTQDNGVINYNIKGDSGKAKCNAPNINECTTDLKGIRACDSCGDVSSVTPCNGLCSMETGKAICSSTPFILSISKTKSNDYKDSFTQDDNIVYEYKVSSSLTKADKIELYLNTPTSRISLSGAVSPTLPFSSSVNIPKQTPGEYSIEVIVKYGTESYNLGKKTFSIATPIYLSSRFYSEKGGTGIIYTNEPSYVQIDSWDSKPESETRNRVDIKNQNCVGTINGQAITSTKQCSFSTCTFKFDVNTEGQFTYDCSAESLMGYKTSIKGQTEVKTPYVKPEFTNMDKLECVQPNVPVNIKLQTKNPQGELIPSDDVITISKPVGKEALTINCPSGDCNFDYTFKTEGGHTFEAVSSSPGYLSYPSVQSMFIYVKSDCTPLECTQASDCDYPKTCINNKCVTDNPIDPTIYYIITFGGIGVVILIIVLIVLLKRKKPTGSLSGL